jgi:DNA-directed RNA polymerase subunit RPC12/RpoP
MAVAAKIVRVPTWPGCSRRLGWLGAESARVRCPHCRTRFVALLRPSGQWEALLETDGAVGRMVADWLRPTWDDEDRPAPRGDIGFRGEETWAR